MRMLCRILLAVCCVSVSLSMAGCEKNDGSATAKMNTFMQKGLSYYHQGNFVRALRYFEKALVIEQKNPEAILYTALMYDELETDLNKAAKLYEQFIGITTDIDRKRLAKNWLKSVESRISALKTTDYASVKNVQATDADNDQSVISRLTTQVAQRDKSIADLSKELTLTREMLDNVLAKEKEYKKTIEQLTGDTDGQKHASYAAKPAVTAQDYRTSIADNIELHELSSQPVALTATYTVREGDTLQSIAQQCYGDDELWTVLWETNKFQMGSYRSLTVGQVLVIPKLVTKK